MIKNSAIKALCSAVAQTLKEERLRQNLSMNALAERAGLSQQMVSYVERGMRTPTLDTLFRLSLALEIELSAIAVRATRTAKRKT